MIDRPISPPPSTINQQQKNALVDNVSSFLDGMKLNDQQQQQQEEEEKQKQHKLEQVDCGIQTDDLLVNISSLYFYKRILY